MRWKTIIIPDCVKRRKRGSSVFLLNHKWDKHSHMNVNSRCLRCGLEISVKRGESSKKQTEGPIL